ncbi:hypothetical protein FRC00_013852 [Tulasnella sp. 408]|nr:hypothetical protein FRC00_013852 [Tulasnella sp. 408]
MVSSGPKLRAVRGPTFTDVPSPRRSTPGNPFGRSSPTDSKTSLLRCLVPSRYHQPQPGRLRTPRSSPKPVEVEPAPAPTPAPPQPVAQPPKPQALTISSANLSPTGTEGKQRGLGLSNYVSLRAVSSFGRPGSPRPPNGGNTLRQPDYGIGPAPPTKFDIPRPEELSPRPLGPRPSPSASSSSRSENGLPTKSGLTMKSGKSKKRRDQPDNTPVPFFG